MIDLRLFMAANILVYENRRVKTYSTIYGYTCMSAPYY